MSWTEPFGFVYRVMTMRGWLFRAAIFLASGGAFATLLAIEAVRGQGPADSVAEAVFVGALIGLLFAFLVDAAQLQRTVSFGDDSLSYLGVAGTFVSAGSFHIDHVAVIELVRADKARSFGILVLTTHKGKQAAFGIPAKVDIERIARILYDKHYPVILPDWSPDAPLSTVTPQSKASSQLPVAEARIEVLDEPGRAFSRFVTGTSLVIGLGPTVVSVITGLALLAYAYFHRDAWPLVHQLPWVGAGLVLAVGGIAYLIFFGELLGSRYLASVVCADIGRRLHASVDPAHPDAIFVERVPRDHWTQKKLCDNDEFGMLWVDKNRRCLLFEGTLERWNVPAGSIVSAQIESYFPPVVQADQEEQERFVVVLQFQTAAGMQEAPLAKMRLRASEIRDKQGRRKGADDLCRRIHEIL